VSIQIDLRQCQTKVISLPEDHARRGSVSALCESLGLSYELIDAIKCSPGHVGCGLSHLKALRAAEGQLPLLVLEDDIAVSEHYTPILTVPDDADAVWLGASIFGAVSIVNYVGFIHMQLADEAEHDLLRVHNLLSTHAILYLTERFRRAAVNSITKCVVDLGRPPDCGLAMIESDFNVYAVKEMRFYQAAELQPPGRAVLEEWTRLTLKPSVDGFRCLIDAPGEIREVKSIRTPRGPEWTWADRELESEERP
jgi:hypothetical protein